MSVVAGLPDDLFRGVLMRVGGGTWDHVLSLSEWATLRAWVEERHRTDWMTHECGGLGRGFWDCSSSVCRACTAWLEEGIRLRCGFDETTIIEELSEEVRRLREEVEKLREEWRLDKLVNAPDVEAARRWTTPPT